MNGLMAIKKPLKGVYVLLVIWGAMIAYMGYSHLFKQRHSYRYIMMTGSNLGDNTGSVLNDIQHCVLWVLF